MRPLDDREQSALFRALGRARARLARTALRRADVQRAVLDALVEPLAHGHRPRAPGLDRDALPPDVLAALVARVHALAGCQRQRPARGPAARRALGATLGALPLRGDWLAETLARLPAAAAGPDAPALGEALATWQRLRNRLAEAHWRLVLAVARRTRGGEFDDRVQWGAFGLLAAIERFDPRRGRRFSTYAVPWIRHAIRRGLGREAPPGPAPARLDARAADDDRPPEARLPDPLTPTPEEAALGRLTGARLARALTALPPLERRVLGLRYGLDPDGPLGLAAAARALGLSRARARRAERRALRRLGAALGRPLAP